MIGTLVCAMAICLTLATGSKAQEIARPDLTGWVLNASGDAVANATVFIYTAALKKGYSTYCPSCYADCVKSATTDAAGAFTIESLDPELYFNLLTAADGYKPTLTKRIDPLDGPVPIEMKKRPDAPDDLRQLVRGQVVNADGEPVVGAVVSPQMIFFAQGGGRGGGVAGLDQLSVTNLDGQFEIRYTGSERLSDMDLEIAARGFAPHFYPKCATGGEQHVLSLDVGATVAGRLMLDGQPLSGVQMGLVQADRGADKGWFGALYIGTDTDGYFSFENVAVGYHWYLYGTMNSVREFGAVAVHPVETSSNGESINVGAIPVADGHHFKGQVIQTDGKPIEPGMRIFISRGRAWDTQIVELPADGSFEFVGLPMELYDISVAIRGYRLSLDNPNRAWSIEGIIDHDYDGFVILVEPGKEDYTNRYGGLFDDKPLRSAERP